eukprot:5539235-Amphidinium_carterae.1
MEGMLALLSWRFAREGEEYHDFEFKALGTLVGRCNFARSYLEGLGLSGWIWWVSHPCQRYYINNRPKVFMLSSPRQQVILHTEDFKCHRHHGAKIV